MASVLIWTACGGGSPGGGGGGGAPTQGNVQVKIGDAPSDSIVSFELTFNSITLTPSGGGTPVTILSAPTRVEIVHTSAVFEPLAVANIPAGTYTSASITVATPEVVIVNAGQPQPLTSVLSSPNVTVNFPSAITISPGASILLFDMNLASSVVISGGVATVTPAFTVTPSSIAAQNQQDHETGELEDVTGVVTSVSGASFTITVTQAASPLTFTTDSATQFQSPLSNVSSIQVGMVVEVDAVTQSSGALLATKVDAETIPNGLEVEGFVTSVTGNPVTQFQMVVQESAGASGTPASPGTLVSVNIDSNTSFRIDNNHVDLSGLTFTFNASSLRVGQQVEVDVDPPLTGTPPADKITLKQGTLSGTISNLTQSSTSTSVFTLTVDPTFSAFALISGRSTLTVFQQPGTELKNITTLANGQVVRVRGLVFFDTATSSYVMVAGRITP